MVTILTHMVELFHFLLIIYLEIFFLEFESPHETIKWFNWLKFPVFFGQVTGAYEGIGTVGILNFY